MGTIVVAMCKAVRDKTQLWLQRNMVLQSDDICLLVYIYGKSSLYNDIES